MSGSFTLLQRRNGHSLPSLTLTRSQSSTPEPSPVARSVSPSRASSSRASSTRTASSTRQTPIHKRLAELRSHDEVGSLSYTKAELATVNLGELKQIHVKVRNMSNK